MIRKLNYTEARRHAAETIRNFLAETGYRWCWDNYISLSTEFPDLEALRNSGIDLHTTHLQTEWYCNVDDLKLLRELLDELDRAF